MILEMRHVVKRYGDRLALDDLDLAVADGTLFAFLGPNGAGKTTAIRILTGLTAMTSGTVRVAGLDIGLDPLAAKRLCGLAAQNLNLDGELTVRENLEFHGRLHAMPRSERLARARELLDYVEMAERADSQVKTLSGGLKRRLMVARALMHRPRLLFLDEPTVGLDPAIRRRVWNLIKRVRNDGTAVFLTTHYIEEAEFLADRVGFINAGRLVAEDAPAAVMARIGQWAVDLTGESDMETSYFATRAEAHAWMRGVYGEASLRRVNLEDAFLALTGRRVT